MNKYKKVNNHPNDLSTDRINDFKTKVNMIKEQMKNHETNDCFYNDEDKKLCAIIAAEELAKEYLLTHRKNNDIDTIIKKVRLIDYINSTNLRMYEKKITFYDIAKHIKEIDFDEQVKKGEPQLVNQIAGLSVNLFSFATKYCCYHNYLLYDRDDYSIYDTALSNAIPKYLQMPTKTYLDEKIRKAINYEEYKRITCELIEAYNITTSNSYRDTDFYLWYHNK